MGKGKLLRSRVLVSIISLLFSSSIFNVLANEETPKETITFSALEFTGAVQQNRKGAFDYFARDLSSRLDVEFDYHVMSPARGARAFFENQKRCLIPSSLYLPYFEGYDVIHSTSFAEVRYLAFTQPGKTVIENKEQMKDKVIGVIRDENTWDFEKRFNIEGATYVKVAALASLVELLYRGRIDVAIHDHSDFVDYVRYSQKESPGFSLQQAMAVDKVVITCHNTPKNRQFMERLDKEITKIIKDGLGQYYRQASID